MNKSGTETRRSSSFARPEGEEEEEEDLGVRQLPYAGRGVATSLQQAGCGSDKDKNGPIFPGFTFFQGAGKSSGCASCQLPAPRACNMAHAQQPAARSPRAAKLLRLVLQITMSAHRT